ncbi:MAG TPA: RHS repeat-associated core domain-containing protein [Ktedonobacteraceae bacterium]
MTYSGADQNQRVQAGTTSYVNAPFGISSQTSSSGSTYYTRDNRGNLVDERTPSGTFYYLFDGLGSVVGLTDSSGALEGNERYVYDPYGTITNTVSSTQMVANPWRFVSGYFDANSGLTKFGIRYDDTSVGRWTQRMPVGGSLQEMTKANPYMCTADDPVNVTDTSGAACDPLLAAGALWTAIGSGILMWVAADAIPATALASFAEFAAFIAAGGPVVWTLIGSLIVFVGASYVLEDCLL